MNYTAQSISDFIEGNKDSEYKPKIKLYGTNTNSKCLDVSIDVLESLFTVINEEQISPSTEEKDLISDNS